MKKRKVKRGFTLVELLAVIVILAIILVIAVPQIMSVIESARKGSIESTAKLIASSADREYTNRKILGKTTNVKCVDVVNLNDNDYGTCVISFDSAGKSTVTITGKGKFEGYTCVGSSTNMECTKGEPIPTDAQYFTYSDAIDEVIVKDKDKCVNYYITTRNVTEEEANTLCSGNAWDDGWTLKRSVRQGDIPSSDYETAGLEIIYGVSITGYNVEGGLDVVIPSKINDKNVVEIGNTAFVTGKYPDYVGLGITSVIIPNTVEFIEYSAFYGNQLTSLTIPSSVTRISEDAFAKNQLESITFPSTPLTLNCYPFRNNPITSDNTYTYPSNVTMETCSPR